jgi:hypothetical protein
MHDPVVLYSRAACAISYNKLYHYGMEVAAVKKPDLLLLVSISR